MFKFLKQNKKEILKNFRHHYRLVIMNDDTFGEAFSTRITPMKVVTTTLSFIIILIVGLISLIAFTPLREYIPGYTDAGMRKKLIRISLRSDSLERELYHTNLYLESINKVLKGDLKPDSANLVMPVKNAKLADSDMSPSKKEQKLRKYIESEDKYTITSPAEKTKKEIQGHLFFLPLKGIITQTFSFKKKHLGVDIVAKENESIKSTLDGTVLLAAWTTETGYTISVQHEGNLISIYKHNSALLKKTGDVVKAGDPIAIIGNSGEQTTGPHLHFELWHNGTAVDPKKYIPF